MRAEDTLQYMTDFYPTIFPTRKHCLDYLFCVIGNGYKWKNGELVCDDEYIKRYKLRKSIKKAEFKNEAFWNGMNILYNSGDKQKIPIEYNFTWYPLSKKYSYLYNYPEDIKDDWRALLEECKQLLIVDGIDIENVDE